MTTYMLFGLLGGMAMLLYGMRLVGEGLQLAAGGKLRQALASLTRNRVTGLLAGAIITAIIQSSGATTVMLVGFASSGLITLPQTLGVILGADIGTTVTVQLIAFQFAAYALVLVGIGFALTFWAKRHLFRYAGEAILGFGLIFLAIQVMGEVTAPLRESPLISALLVSLGDYPFLGLLVAAAFTALVCSSAATLGLAVALAGQGLLPLRAALPVMLGANIGTCATALASSLGGNVEARRVAVAHTAFKVLGVAVCLPFLAPFARLAAWTAPAIPRQLANAHSLFNVGMAVLFLPATTLLAQGIAWLVPEREEPGKRFGPQYLQSQMLETPALALGQATREALRMADLVSEMLGKAVTALSTDDLDLIDAVEAQDDQVDTLNRAIKRYLTQLAPARLTEEQRVREFALLSFIDNLENIGDILDRNLMELAKKRLKLRVHFSAAGLEEIRGFHQEVTQNLARAVAAFAGSDARAARMVLEQKLPLRQLERRCRQAHIQRLHEGYRESFDTSDIHLDILANLKRINSHITAIAYPVIERSS
jgi:phosphate:Na+ symporter